MQIKCKDVLKVAITIKKYGYCYPLPVDIVAITLATSLMAIVVYIINLALVPISVFLSLFSSIIAGVLVYSVIHIILNTMNCRSYLVNKKA